MYIDALTLAAVAAELREAALGGRVQRVVRPSELSLGLEIYRGERHQLLVSAEPRSARMLLSSHRLRRGTETPSPFELLLRKHVRGARLVDVRQPHLERVLVLDFAGEEGERSLVCEIMGRYSNLILLDAAGVILDAAKRVPPSVNRYRSVLPQGEYVPPPPQDKEDPLLLTPGILGRLLAAADAPALWRRLTATVAGVSPIVAREIVHRALGRADAPASALRPEHLGPLVEAARELFALLETGAWAPCVAYEDAEERVPVAYAAYALTQYPAHERVPTMSAAIEAVLAAEGSVDPYRSARERLVRLVDDRIARVMGRIASLQESLGSEEEMEELLARGNAILAMAWAIAPGQTEIEVDAELLGRPPDGEPVRIPLDGRLSAAENAQELFRRYRKLQAAAAGVPALIRKAELERDYLRQLRTDAALATDRAGLDAVEGELREAGHAPPGGAAAPGRRTRAADRQGPLTLRAPDGTWIVAGRNSRENDEVTFRIAAPDDLWLHAHGVPGSHVVIRSGGAEVDEETLRRAAGLAAYLSAAREEPRVQVDYTQRRHVRRIRGARPGMVTYRQEETLVVSPEPPDEEE